MSPFLPTTMSKTINEIVAHDDPDFIQAHILKLKESLTNCHNELQMAYGELHAQKKRNKQLWLLYDKAQRILWKNGLDIEEDEESI